MPYLMRAVFAFFLSVLCLATSAQMTGLNNDLKFLLEEKSTPGHVCDILVKGNIARLRGAQQTYGYTLNYFAGDIASVNIDISTVPTLIENKIISYAEYIPARKRTLNDTMVWRNRIKQVKLWTAPLPQAYNGEGVIMGIVDSGIDFSHPDFKDSLGKSRIRFLWDQNQTTGSVKPQPFNYGIEWSKAQIDNNQCTHSDLAQFGHGTHVSGIAAGNGRATGRFEGCASRSDMIVVALDFNKVGPTTADAVNYIFSKAAALGKPCAINASVGDYYGSHDATDLETQLIENMLKNIPGRVLVAAAGNAGNVQFHVKTQPAANDTLFTWINTTGSVNYQCYADTAQVKNLKFRIGANRANFSNIGAIAFKSYNYALGSVRHDTLKNAGNKRIGIVHTSASVNSKGVYELQYNIMPDSANLFWRVETKGSGLHHAWNFDFVSGGLPGASQYPFIAKYVSPDSMYSMVSGFQCSEEVITVANYCNLYRYYDVTNTLQNSGLVGGQLAGTSSSGPTRDGRIKPDVAATGQGVFSAMALGMQANLLANAPSVVAQGSMHVAGGGTSASSPVVAGLAALYLQRYPSATNNKVRDAVRFCAYSDAYTGSNLPNYQWGFGKLDGKASMYCGEGIYNGLSTSLKNETVFFPNPFKEKVTLELGSEHSGELQVYSICGDLLFKDNFTGKNYVLNSAVLPAGYNGLLLVRINNGGNITTIKLVKQDQ